MSAMEKFEFTVDGKKYELPPFSQLKAGSIRKARNASDDMDRAFLIIEAELGENSKELAALDRLTVQEFGEVLKGWTQGAPVGESSDS